MENPDGWKISHLDYGEGDPVDRGVGQYWIFNLRRPALGVFQS
jgi:hypothetical protein